MYYSYVEIEYVDTSFSPARTDLALKLLSVFPPTYEVRRHMRAPLHRYTANDGSDFGNSWRLSSGNDAMMLRLRL